jgi:hypothetical protein
MAEKSHQCHPVKETVMLRSTTVRAGTAALVPAGILGILNGLGGLGA